MDVLFEIKDNGLYYREKLVGTFVDPTRHRWTISCLADLLDCAYHPLTKWFIAEETGSGDVADRARHNVFRWRDELGKVLAKIPDSNTPYISDMVSDSFEESCAIEWYRLFCLDWPTIEKYQNMPYDAVKDKIEGSCPDEFLCIAGGSDEEREDYNDGTMYDLMDVASRSFDGVVQGDCVSMHFVRNAPFIKIADRDLALQVFNPKFGEWTKLMQNLTEAAVRIKNDLWLIASRTDDDEDN